MSSAICFDLGKSEILSSGNGLSNDRYIGIDDWPHAIL